MHNSLLKNKSHVALKTDYTYQVAKFSKSKLSCFDDSIIDYNLSFDDNLHECQVAHWPFKLSSNIDY